MTDFKGLISCVLCRRDPRSSADASRVHLNHPFLNYVPTLSAEYITCEIICNVQQLSIRIHISHTATATRFCAANAFSCFAVNLTAKRLETHMRTNF